MDINYPFLENKYTKWYVSIITHARTKVNNGYTELHHIIPRCLGGRRTKDNEVKLSAREHFVCHMLLRKMTIGEDKKKMSFAAFAVSRVRRNSQLRINSRTFDLLRHELSNARTGVPRSVETKQKISKAKIGTTLSDSTKLAISIGTKQRYYDHPVSEETRTKIGMVHKGKTLSVETKNKIGLASKGRTTGGEKEWTLKDPLRNLYKIVMLSKFCKERGLPWKSISNTEGTNTPVTKGIAKGWIAIKSSRLWCV
jgi:hypothetical protein